MSNGIGCDRCGRSWKGSPAQPLREVPRHRCVPPSALPPLDFQFATWPCPHRGPRIGTTSCQACGIRAPIEIAACHLHGRCVPSPVKTPGAPTAACSTCRDRPRRRRR